MSKNAVGLPDTVLRTSFVALVMSLAGWALLEAWLLALHANLRAHLLASAAGFGLLILSLKPLPSLRHGAAAIGTGAALRSALFLFAIGALLGIATAAGSNLALLAVASGLGVFPWSRSLLCRQRFLAAAATLCAGAAGALALGREAVGLMFLPFAGWVFWMCAAAALLVRAARSGRTAPARAGVAAPMARRQDGAFAIMFVPLLIVIIGFCGLAIDMGRLYNRQVDLDGLAKAVALAAARELNGTPAGIMAAKTRARETAERLRYDYYFLGNAFTWDDAALSFSNTPDRSGSWTPASALDPNSSAQASSLYFARVDSDGLAATISTVQTIFIKILASSLADVRVRDSAVAGRASINVTPIGICAMSNDRAVERPALASNGSTLTELVQYGFRRGVSYDLMQLNPNGTTPARFALNPVAAPGSHGPAFTMTALRPFVCSGTIWMPGLSGGQVSVSALPASAPLADLYLSLNARFNEFSGSSCLSGGSPSDSNIKGYAYTQSGGVRWMDPATGRAAALTTTERNRLETVADLPDNHPTKPAARGDYGPLWAYARAVRAPSPVTAEPATDYTPFDATTWATLYKSGPTVISGYPGSTTPYYSTSSSGGFYAAPTLGSGEVALRHRRVLNIPLLSCSPSAPSGSNVNASVAAIGRFFMTVRATEESLIAEFGGLASEQSVSGEVRLYP